MPPSPDRDALARLAAAHGVATSYEGSDRTPVTVDDATMIATSFPAFAGLMTGLGAGLGEPA